MLLQSLNDFSDNSFPKGDIKYKINNLEKYKKMDFDSLVLSFKRNYTLHSVELYLLHHNELDLTVFHVCSCRF